MSDIKFTVNVDEYLSLNKYEVDESNAHIELVEDPSDEEFDKLILVCPAALYKRDEDGKKSFDYAGCLECGPLPLRLWRHHHQEVGKPAAYHGCGVPLRLSQARYIAYKERSLRAPFFICGPDASRFEPLLLFRLCMALGSLWVEQKSRIRLFRE